MNSPESCLAKLAEATARGGVYLDTCLYEQPEKVLLISSVIVAVLLIILFIDWLWADMPDEKEKR